MVEDNPAGQASLSGMERPPLVFPHRAPRERTYLSGKLVYDSERLTPEGTFTLGCTIRDISEGGAKVTLGCLRPLPADLYLIVVKRCVAYRATVVWLNAPSRGLRFSQRHPLDGTLPASLKFLRHLWNELTDRDGALCSNPESIVGPQETSARQASAG